MIFKYLREPNIGDVFPCRDAFKYLETGMKCVGWLRPQRGSRCYWFYIIWMVWMLGSVEIYFPIVFTMGYIGNFNSITPNEFISSLQVFFNLMSLNFKVAVIQPNIWRFKKAKELLDIMDKRCVTDEQRIEVNRCVVRCNYIYMIYQIVYFVYVTLTFLCSAFTGSTPWACYNPFVDYRKDTKSFWIASIIEYIIGSGAVYADQMTDIYPVVFGLVLRTQIKLLAQRIQRLRTDPTQSEKESYEDLVNCIKDHKLMLQYCDVFRPVISLTIFSQLLVIGLGLGLSLINIMFFASFWTGLIIFSFVFVLAIQSFPFGYVCELINDDCYKLSLDIFYTNWFSASLRYKSALIYFLHNAQQSIHFIAGGIFPICMKTNIDFAKIAFSVVTVAKQMNIVEKLTKKDINT